MEAETKTGDNVRFGRSNPDNLSLLLQVSCFGKQERTQHRPQDLGGQLYRQDRRYGFHWVACWVACWVVSVGSSSGSKLPGLSFFIRSCHPFMIGESATAGYPSEEKGLETDGNGTEACNACDS